jgi:hypothetical protein
MNLPERPRRAAAWVAAAGRRGSLPELALFALLAVWATWPLARHAGDALPLGTERVATVPLFNLWTVWWNADRATHGFRGYWDAPIFHPTPNTFSFSEPQPTMLVVAPLVRAAETPVVAYNVYLLLALTLNGWSAFRLLRRLELDRLVALFGGGMVSMLTIVHWQLGVLQLVPLFGAIWALHALYDFGERPAVGTGVRLGLAFALTFLLCIYHALFLSVLLLLAGGWLLGRQMIRWKTWANLLPGAAASLLVILPALVVLRAETKEHNWKRTERELLNLSAAWGDYTVTPWPQLVPLGDFADEERRPYWQLSPGWLKLGLAAVGIVWGLALRRWRCWTLFCATLTVAALALSLGPRFTIGSWTPYGLLVDYYPGFAQARNVFRFAYFAQLGIALLAVLGVQCAAASGRWLGERATAAAGFGNRALPALLSGIVAVAVGGPAVAEVRPPTQKLFFLPPLEENRAWIAWVKENTPSDAVLACLPFPRGRTAAAYQETTVWMYWGTFHRRRMVNGYSGFFPRPFLDLKEEMEYFPDPESLEAVREYDVAWSVIHRSWVTREEIERDPEVAPHVRWRFGDDRADLDIYEIVPPSHGNLR